MNLCIILSLTIAVLSVALYPLLNSTQTPSSSSSSSSSSSVVADLMVTNGTIYTSDASLPFADSMALSSGRLLRLGNFSSLQDLAGYGTEVIDLEGKVVVPGFIDSHVHLIFGGLQIVRVELRGVNKKDEFVRKVKDAVANLKHGSWVLGGGWNNDNWGGELPMASWIDDITPHNPVWLSRMDGHMGLANSLALKIAEISNYTEDPNGGAIMRTTDGEVYRRADVSGQLKIRVCLFFPMNTWSRLQDLIRESGRKLSQWLYLGGVKAFADGSLGSNSALFYEPYVDDPRNSGLQVTDLESLLNMTVASDRSGLQVAIHAIGDRANDLILDMYKSVVSTNGMRDRRFRIEHAQHLADGTVARFGQEGIVASVQVLEAPILHYLLMIIY